MDRFTEQQLLYIFNVASIALSDSVTFATIAMELNLPNSELTLLREELKSFLGDNNSI